RAAIGSRGVTVTDVVDRVAGMGRQIVLSPDGNWLCVPGEEEWTSVQRPSSRRTDFGLPVFSPHDFRQLVTYVALDKGCRTAAFNPVTWQLAVVSDDTTRIVQMGGVDSASTLAIKSGGVCAWSGNGKYLLVSGLKSGIHMYANPLHDAEVPLAANWHEALEPAAQDNRATQWAVRSVPPVRSLETFQVSSQRAAVAKTLSRGISSTRTEGLIRWEHLEDYLKNSDSLRCLSSLRKLLRDKDNPFGRVEQAAQAAEQFPRSSPILYELAVVQAEEGDDDEAIAAYQRVIRGDAGRTFLTIDALLGLAKTLNQSNRPMEAAFCGARAIAMDPVNPDVSEAAAPYLRAAGFGDEVASLKKNRNDLTRVANNADRLPAKLPTLTNPAPDARKKPPALIYAQSVPSVVVVRAGDRLGTGFCIANGGYVLTSELLVAGHDTVDVIPFAHSRGQVSKLATTQGRVMIRRINEQIAILKLVNPPKTLTPLPVAQVNPRAGAQVYAIGNPGTADGLLEQTMTDGIISFALRQRQNRSYVQHTAAVNPGAAGGPLLDIQGNVIGICTGDEQLDGLGLAVPASVIRSVFEPQTPE
ncbi:MAG: trypsin-like peptidase domain-containing protein, partial [Pirellulales bacterium]